MPPSGEKKNDTPTPLGTFTCELGSRSKKGVPFPVHLSVVHAPGTLPDRTGRPRIGYPEASRPFYHLRQKATCDGPPGIFFPRPSGAILSWQHGIDHLLQPQRRAGSHRPSQGACSAGFRTGLRLTASCGTLFLGPSGPQLGAHPGPRLHSRYQCCHELNPGGQPVHQLARSLAQNTLEELRP